MAERILSFTIPGLPVAQGRSRHRIAALPDGTRFVRQYDPPRSRDWKATVRQFAARAMGGAPPLEGPVVLEAVFMFPAPLSWPKRKLAALDDGHALPKPTKPDLKNLIAGTEDGMRGIVFRDDALIWNYGHSRKVYGLRAEVRIVVKTGATAEEGG